MHRIEVYLKHILDECEFLIKYSKDKSAEEFVKDEVLKKAFVRSLEVIGEAVKKLPLEFKLSHSEIPWKLIAGMRDKLIHEYFGVNYQIVWQTVKEEIPRLKEKIQKLLLEIQKSGVES